MSCGPGTSDASVPDDSALSDSELQERLRIQFSSLDTQEQKSQIDQLLDAHSRRRLSLDNSLAIRVGDRICGVLTIAIQPDGTINFWPAAVVSSLRPEECAEMQRKLYSQAIDFFKESGSWIAQCLLAQQGVVASRELAAAGIPRLTELSFLARSLDEKLPPVPEQSMATIEEFDSEHNRERFANLLERTWQGTLDCPELNGCRSGVEALDGHQLAGEFSPDRWLLFSVDGADVGVLLLTNHPDEQVWEVVYFGVAAEARGQGLGRVILLEGLRRAQQAGALELVLAVDARNSPALKLYTELGFRPFDRRVVHALLRKPEG